MKGRLGPPFFLEATRSIESRCSTQPTIANPKSMTARNPWGWFLYQGSGFFEGYTEVDVERGFGFQ